MKDRCKDHPTITIDEGPSGRESLASRGSPLGGSVLGFNQGDQANPKESALCSELIER